MNEHHLNGTDIFAFAAGFTTIFSGWHAEQWFGLIGVFGVVFAIYMQIRRDKRERRKEVREEELHYARMAQLEKEQGLE